MTDLWIPPQTLDPTTVKAVVTTKWAGTAYKSATIRRVEAYSISSNLDSDADPWTLDLGNPDADLNPVLVRDNEVRVEVFGASVKGKVPLLVGLMDDATYSEQGTLQLSGRDMSCVATDSDHFPNIYRGLSPTKIIEMEARAIKCTTKFKIKPIIGGPKRQETDGSEKFWEFWYRMVRKDGMWIWMQADSTLVIDKLHYNNAPSYVFASAAIAKGKAIPVESFSWHKTTQNRLRKLGVEWRTQGITAGIKPTVTIVRDPGTSDWIKQANKLMQDKHAVSEKSATKIGQEEIFETKVGAIEIVLTVADPGYLIQQDRIAHVDLPEYGIKGNWYVVGATIKGDASGFMQDVRLRERKFAISKKVPDDPVWTQDPSANVTGEPAGSGKAVLGKMGNHPEWWDCFLAAAQRWHGLYDLALFMATLLAIADHETSFRNIRSNDENDGRGNTISAPGEHEVEWYDIRQNNPTPSALDKWKLNFANEGGDGYVRWNCAVGPMQLFDSGLKREADGGKADEFFGKRWDACSNIMVAAHKLNTVARTTNGSQDDLWAGVCLYGGYTDPNCAYGQDIRNRVLNDPGWLALVEAALGSIQPPDPGSGNFGAYVSPFPIIGSLVPERIDMGVDYYAPLGTEIVAMGRARICVVNHSREGESVSDWPPFVSYILLDGDHAGEIVYVAENIRIRADLVAQKTIVQPGEQIAIFTGGIETGFAANTTGDSTCVEDPEPHANNPMGKAFARWLVELGCPISNKPAPPGPGTTHSQCKSRV